MLITGYSWMNKGGAYESIKGKPAFGGLLRPEFPHIHPHSTGQLVVEALSGVPFGEWSFAYLRAYRKFGCLASFCTAMHPFFHN